MRGDRSYVREAFSKIFNGMIELPDSIDNKGKISQIGWEIRYIIITNEIGEKCLDFTAAHQLAKFRHIRIERNGRVIHLDGFLTISDFKFRTSYEKEDALRQLIRHNEKVTEVLKAKGLME